MRRTVAAAMLLGCFALAAGMAPARAQDDDTVDSGKDAYLRHCAVCHGLEGYGNGPLAEAMKIEPSDLTRLAVKHGGDFPAAKVSDVIRNGGAVLGHGSPTMPAWGLYFAEKRKPEVLRARVKALVDYLESIQTH
jgi:mono/diheme cytochrome c family protein